MLCQTKMLLLIQKFNFFILYSSGKQILNDAIGVNSASNYGRCAL